MMPRPAEPTDPPEEASSVPVESAADESYTKK